MNSAGFHVAQLNIAKPKGDPDGPLLADFKAALDPINALADTHPGFVWRLQDDTGNATALRIFGDDSQMINMSVWESIESLQQFVYKSRHVEPLLSVAQHGPTPHAFTFRSPFPPPGSEQRDAEPLNAAFCDFAAHDVPPR